MPLRSASVVAGVTLVAIAVISVALLRRRKRAKEDRPWAAAEPGSPLGISRRSRSITPTLQLKKDPGALKASHVLFNQPNDWQNPLCLGRNRERPRPSLASHRSAEAARANVEYPEASENVLSLNGTWSFALFRSPADALKKHFPDPGAKLDGKVWTHIKVPSCWQLQNQLPPDPAPDSGADTAPPTAAAVPADATRRWDLPIYCNFQYPIPVTPPNVPALNPTGCYRRRVLVPARWRQERRRVMLHFAGVDSAFYAWCNGRLVGFSKDSRLPAEFDITSALDHSCDEGVDQWAVLAVLVVRWSDGTFLEDQDHWRLSGIHREVRLIGVPSSAAIVDYSWTSELELKPGTPPETPFSDAVLKVRALVESRPFLPGDAVAVSAALYAEGVMPCPEIDEESDAPAPARAPQGHNNDNGSSAIAKADVQVVLDSTGHVSVELELRVPAPQAWSSERPYLYTLVLGSGAASGAARSAQYEVCRVGFRLIQIAEGELRLNGRRITVAGVNRHEHCELGGKTIARAGMLADVLLLKRNNFNATRCSHYPNAPFWYELANRLGLLVVDEANIETHGMQPYPGYLSDHPDWRDAYLDRVQRMWERDKTHPCIVAWSLGNESGYGTHHDDAAAWLRSIDSSRVVMYEPASYGVPASRSGNGGSTSGGGGGGGFRSDAPADKVGTVALGPATDVIAPMYARLSELKALALASPGVPIIQCEYSHAMGNSNGGLDRYWKLYRGPGPFQGGFIWDWVDQGLRALVWSNSGFALGLDALGQVPRSGIGLADVPPEGKAALIVAKGGRFRRWEDDARRLYTGVPDDKEEAREMWAYGGDFGEQPTDNDFCCNGLIWPDRTPHPAVAEIKYLQQPFDAQLQAASVEPHEEAAAPAGGAARTLALKLKLAVENRYAHIDDLASQLLFCFDVVLDGQVIASDLSEPEGQASGRDLVLHVRADIAPLPAAPGHECFLNLTAKLREDRPWAPAGHVVGWQQFSLDRQTLAEAWAPLEPANILPPAANDRSPSLRPGGRAVPPPPTVQDTSDSFTVTVPGAIRVKFSKRTGHIVELDHLNGSDDGGSEAKTPLLAEQQQLDADGDLSETLISPLTVQLHRGPTSNDRGGYLLQWQAAGVGASELGCSVTDTATTRRADGAVVFTAAFKLTPSGASAPLCRLMQRVRMFSEAAEAAAAAGKEAPPPLVLRDLSANESAFARALAAAWRLGHAGEAQGSSCRIWWPSLRLCSTHPLAAGMSLAPEAADATGGHGTGNKLEGGGSGGGGESYDFQEATCGVVYTVLPSGAMTVSVRVELPQQWPPVPRVGLRMLLPEAFGTVEWFGRGPHECYPDRKASAMVAGYSGGVDAMETRYIRPGEAGSRADVRWVALAGDGGGNGHAAEAGAAAVRAWPTDDDAAAAKSNSASTAPVVCVTSSKDFSFSVSRSLPQDFDRRHPEQVPRRPFVALNLDAAVMGVGGDDSWSAAVHDDMLLKPGLYTFDFALMARGDTSLKRVANGALDSRDWAAAAYRYLRGVLAAGAR